MTGWYIRPLQRVGKTEVLASNLDALRALKKVAISIPSSDIYPSFSNVHSHTFFFFDVRPEFITWLNEYAAATPIEPEQPTSTTTATPRRFGFSDLGLATSLLTTVLALFFWLSPLVSRADVLSIPPHPPSRDLATTDTSAIEVADTIAITVADLAHDTTIASDTSAPALPLRRAPTGELKIWFVDVGQGDGIILRLPGGEFIVVDCNQGAGAKMVALLRSLGCSRIRAIVMSHPHADHLGGLADVLDAFPVQTFYDPGLAHPTMGYRRLLEAVERHRCEYVLPRPGDKISWDPKIKVTVLNSGGEASGGANNVSIVLRIEFERSALLLTGDAEKEVEAHIVERYGNEIHSDLLKSGHHGSRTSSTPAFLRAVAPKYVVISCGAGNTYGHPAPVTLHNYETIGATVFRTDLSGTVTAVSNGSSWLMSTER